MNSKLLQFAIGRVANKLYNGFTFKTSKLDESKIKKLRKNQQFFKDQEKMDRVIFDAFFNGSF